MSETLIRQAIASSVVGITRHVMRVHSLPEDEAYRRVYASALYSLLVNPDSRLFLETNEELSRLYDVESSQGVQALAKEVM